MNEPQSFYALCPAGFLSSELTRGPWDAGSQHAGPPAALLGREIERLPGLGEGPEDRLVGRITLEILRPVPIAELEIRAEVVRPGRRVDLVEAELSAGGEPAIRARAWRLQRSTVKLPEGLASEEPGSPVRLPGRPSGLSGEPTPPEQLAARGDAFFPTGERVGYHTAMEYRFVAGGFNELGPGACWMRMRVPLVAGEQPSPLQRVLIAADSGNGISASLDFHRYLFVNVDLTVHLHRMPVSEWVCIDALTVAEPSGVGLADALLSDQRGPIGRACQTLLVSER